MTAIRNRVFEQGYDFTLFVPIGNVKVLPEWLPKTRIWFNFDRFGIDGIISTIQNIISSEEGVEADKILDNKIAQVSKEIDANKSKDIFLDSEEGVKAARIELKSLFDSIEKLIIKIESDTSHIKIKVDRDAGGNAFTLLHMQYYINIEF